MKFSLHAVFLLLFSVIQATWLDYIEIFSIKPNLFVVYIILICCFCSKWEGLVLGFSFGFILDMLIGRIWGLNGLLSMVFGFCLSFFCEKFLSNNNLWISAAFVFVVSFIYEAIYYFFSLIGVDSVSYMAFLWRIIVPECLYNLIVAFPLYFLIMYFAKFFYTDKGETIG